jgi:hypothetical protein
MDTPIIIGTGLAILGSKELLIKLLGPSADYVGGEVKDFVEKCNINLDGIFAKAASKLGNRLDDDGAVSPRVLKHVVDEGRFCEDNLTAEYYGGILASSKNRIARDDRGVTLLAQVKDMSVYQLRLHFVAYMIFHRLFQNEDLNLADENDCSKMRVFIPMSIYKEAMDFQAGEDINAILAHCLFGLGKHNLINNFASGNAEFLQKQNKAISESGLLLTPTLPGAELFLWAIGLPGASGRELLKARIEGDVDGVKIPAGAITFTALDEIVEIRNVEEAEQKKAAKAAAAVSPPDAQGPITETA